MMPASPRYVVVTPARDEADFIGALAETLLSQTVALDSWIVVDDGSDDGTPNVVRRLADADSRVVLLERGPRPGRRVGFGGIESTMVGLRSLDDPFAYDFVANIDADLVLPLDYFERLFREFERDPRLGIAGGHLFLKTERGLVFDRVPDEHVHGATKVYRRECLRDIWPLAEVWGWDAVDEYRAQIEGWSTRSFEEPMAIHAKPMSGGTGKVLQGKFVCGRTCHFLGYRTDFALLRTMRQFGLPPYVVGGLAFGWGFLSGRLLRSETLDDAEVIRYLRGRQAERLRALISAPMSREVRR